MVAMPGAALLELLVAGSITPALLYTMTVVLYLAVRKRFVRREGAFDLGRAELPVAVSALIWMGLVLFVLIAPAASFVPVIIVGGLIVIGGSTSVTCGSSDARSWRPNPATSR